MNTSISQVLILSVGLFLCSAVVGASDSDNENQIILDKGFLRLFEPNSTNVIWFYEHYRSLHALILLGDNDSYVVGMKQVLSLGEECCPDDVVGNNMLHNIAQALAWDPTQFLVGLRKMDGGERLRVLKVYESHFSEYLPPDYAEDFKPMVLQ